MPERLRNVWLVWAVLAAAGCAKSQPAARAPGPVRPLPTAGIAGQRVAVYPLTMVGAVDELDWEDWLEPRRTALDRADSLLTSALSERSPEVEWVFPDELRRAARRGAPMLTNPDQMATSLLRSAGLRNIPDPLRSQMRNLTGVVGDRYALVPASLVFTTDDEGRGRAELTLVIVDVRTGTIGWRTVAHAAAAGPWEALRLALRALTPVEP